MKNLRNERGMALMMAIVLTLISLTVVMAVLYLITQGSKLSASSRRYKSALEASYGGVEVVTKEIMPQLLNGATWSQIANGSTLSGLSIVLTGNNPSFNPTFTTYTSCMKTKLALPSSQWGGMCGASPTSPDPKSGYDVTFKLKGPPLQPNFNVYAKIIDSQPGNSDTSGVDALDSASGVAGATSAVTPKHIPAIYRVEIQGERDTNPLEKAKLSVLYSY